MGRTGAVSHGTAPGRLIYQRSNISSLRVIIFSLFTLFLKEGLIGIYHHVKEV